MFCVDIELLNNKCIKKVSIVGLIFNILLVMVKYILGNIFLINSLTVDSLHSLEDSLSSILGLISSKFIEKKPNKKYQYGYGKIEYIFSLLIGFFMVIASVTMFISSIKSIICLNKIQVSYVVLIACVINILIKLLLYFYAKSNYKKTNSYIIKAMMIDHRNDCIIIAFTIFSIIVSYLGFYYMDGICGIILSVIIGISGIKICVNSSRILMDIGLDENTVDKIKNYIVMFNNTIKIDNIISRNVGEKYIVLVKFKLDKKKNIETICNEIYDIKCEVLKEFSIIKDLLITVNVE